MFRRRPDDLVVRLAAMVAAREADDTALADGYLAQITEWLKVEHPDVLDAARTAVTSPRSIVLACDCGEDVGPFGHGADAVAAWDLHRSLEHSTDGRGVAFLVKASLGPVGAR